MSKNETILLTGNTYEHRNAIARIPGAKWDPNKKAWVVEAGNMRERAIQSQAIHALRAKGVVAASA